MKKETRAKENMRKKRKKSKFRVFIRCLLLIILIGIIGYGIYFAINYNKHVNISKEGKVEYDPLSATALGIDPEKLKSVERLNILVLGESGIGDGYKLTDSIMVASYNPQTQQASILSIPRDTYVGKKDKNSASVNYLASYKMNAAYRNGENIPETIECVSNLIGVDLEHYLLVDTDAIIEIVDAIGGVTFNVPIDMDYDDPTQDLHIHLKAGEQLIDGEKAEQLLRFRHNNDGTSYPMEYGDNDLGRMRTQREFFQETARQLLKIENVTKVLNLMDIVFRNVKTDLDLNTMKYYVPYIFKFNTENIQSDMVPGVPEKVNGVWIFSANKSQTAQIVEDLFTDKIYEEETAESLAEKETLKPKSVTTENGEEIITVELLNATEDKALLTSVRTKLRKAGYDVLNSGTTASTNKTTIINRTNHSKEITNDIKDTLGMGTIRSGSDNSNVDYTIIIGNDYE